MGADTNMLTDTRVRGAKPSQRPIKLSDGGGLHLLVQPHGSKLWRLAYRFVGKQKTLSLGVYPIISLQEARERREAAKRLLAKGIDPSEQRRLDKQIAATVIPSRPSLRSSRESWGEKAELLGH
jgi:hypothetical protein